MCAGSSITATTNIITFKINFFTATNCVMVFFTDPRAQNESQKEATLAFAKPYAKYYEYMRDILLVQKNGHTQGVYLNPSSILDIKIFEFCCMRANAGKEKSFLNVNDGSRILYFRIKII